MQTTEHRRDNNKLHRGDEQLLYSDQSNMRPKSGNLDPWGSQTNRKVWLRSPPPSPHSDDFRSGSTQTRNSVNRAENHANSCKDYRNKRSPPSIRNRLDTLGFNPDFDSATAVKLHAEAISRDLKKKKKKHAPSPSSLYTELRPVRQPASPALEQSRSEGAVASIGRCRGPHTAANTARSLLSNCCRLYQPIYVLVRRGE